MKFYGVAKLRRLILSLSSVLRRDRRIAKSDYYLCHVCLSIRMEQLGSHWKDFHEI